MMNPISITKLVADIVRQASSFLEIEVQGKIVTCPHVNYIFGDAGYVKDMLDDYSKAAGHDKFPLVALFTPVNEQRGVPGCAYKVRVNMLLACSTTKDYSNEEREEMSFEKILRPIYRRIMYVIGNHGQIEVNYDGSIPHDYSENYSYGRYGAYTGNGEKVSEPIDAINISSLEFKVKHTSCR